MKKNDSEEAEPRNDLRVSKSKSGVLAKEKPERKVNTLYLVMTALFVAMTYVGTMVIQIPVGIGYVNFGDAVVMTAGVVLGPVGAMIVGGLGSALADVTTGYLVYAPFTFVIKGLEGLICGFAFKKILPDKTPYLRGAIAFVLCAVLVVIGYFFADFLLTLFGFMGEGGDNVGYIALVNGAATVIPSLVQVGISFAIAMIVAPKLPTLTLMRRNKGDR